jgi:hypothetical protein
LQMLVKIAQFRRVAFWKLEDLRLLPVSSVPRYVGPRSWSRLIDQYVHILAIVEWLDHCIRSVCTSMVVVFPLGILLLREPEHEGSLSRV